MPPQHVAAVVAGSGWHSNKVWHGSIHVAFEQGTLIQHALFRETLNWPHCWQNQRSARLRDRRLFILTWLAGVILGAVGRLFKDDKLRSRAIGMQVHLYFVAH